MSDAFRFQLDHLAATADALFGFGWALADAGRISAATLVCERPGAEPQRVAVSIDRPREDVAAAFPDHPQAAAAGFMLLAGWPGGPPQAAALEFTLEDGSRRRVPLELPCLDAPRRPTGAGWRYFIRRGWAHLKRGRLRAALRKFRDLQRRQLAGARPMADAEFGAALAGGPVAVVVDHCMGGGANAYRDRLIGDLVAEGLVVVLVTFVVSSLTLVAEVHAAGRPAGKVTVSELDALAATLAGARLERVVANCGVSFPRPLELCRFLGRLARPRGIRLEMLIHDYFTVCPSAFLLDDTGGFCGVPDRARCRACLPAHTDGFVALAGCTSIDDWRRAWGDLLAEADTIRCFSESSRRLFGRAYPGLDDKVVVVPHDVPPLRRVRWQAPTVGGPLVVGVIGSISHHKGAAVVADLARAIKAGGTAVRIVVIGQVDAACPVDIVTQTGPYRPAELPGLAERHGLQVVLLPSICPETFSFVAHETLAMGLPLITLDLGGPADLARGHHRGHVSARADGPGLLAEILAFAAALATRPEGASA